ncbi:MAG: hypothetical protein WD851_17015 [Pirellulales bacterium]
MNTYQAVTRTVIMLGTLAVGVMAWLVYGPPPERLAPVVNRAVELVNQTFGRERTEPVAPALPAPQFAAIGDASATRLPPGVALRVDEEVAPATFADDSTVESLDKLLDRLHSLGATDAELKPWGSAGQTYRCQCHLAVADNPGLVRHFDAIATDAQAAVEQVLAEVERFRNRPPN